MIAQVLSSQRGYFETGRSRTVEARRESLGKLSAAMDENEERLCAALNYDLGKSAVEAYTSELGLVQAEIRHALKHLTAWMRPERRRTAFLNFPGRSRIYPEPKGVVLILGPWNYPVQLLLAPLVGALAAGDCAVLKPSELAPATAAVLADMIRATFPVHQCAVIIGGPETAKALLRERWDHIFLTGSGRVGKQVMAAAAEHLTPVTLELGGKNPCLVWRDADIPAAARIAWGKFLNAGQTCVAPDHVWVHQSLWRPLQDALAQSILRFYGPDPRRSPYYGRIVNTTHFDRLSAYLRDVQIAHGGACDRSELYFAPTLITDPAPDAPVMTEEIFGPILPLLPFEDPDELLAGLWSKPKPLTVYLFPRNRGVRERVIRELPSGGLCVNDTVSHLANSDLPFGGVGESGFGVYHGRAGFDAFSHAKSVFIRSTVIRDGFRFPPYRDSLNKIRFFYSRLLGR